MNNKVPVLLFLLVIFGLALRTFPVRTGFHYWDETVYLQHAEIMLGHRSAENFNEFLFRPPLLAIILSAGLLICDSMITLHLIVALLSSIGIIATFFLARLLFRDEKIALLSALIFTLNPMNIQFSHYLLVDAPLAAFFALSILFAYKALSDFRYCFIAGLFMGVAVLFKFTSLALIPVVFVVFFLFYGKREKITRIVAFNRIADMIKSRETLALLLSFCAVLTPYLIWSQLNFGSPFQTFLVGHLIVSSDVTSDALFFLVNLPSLFPVFFLAGIAIFAVAALSERKISKEAALIILCVLIPALLMQTIAHKEMRFLMPVIPFMSILSAKGFLSLPGLQEKSKTLLIMVIALLGILTLSLQPIGSLFSYENSAIVETGLWVDSNLPQNITLYTNYEYPPIAYYSDRKVVILSYFAYDHGNIGSFLQGDAYVITSSITPREPEIWQLMGDERFELVKIFGDEREMMYLFRYVGS